MNHRASGDYSATTVTEDNQLRCERGRPNRVSGGPRSIKRSRCPRPLSPGRTAPSWFSPLPAAARRCSGQSPRTRKQARPNVTTPTPRAPRASRSRRSSSTPASSTRTGSPSSKWSRPGERWPAETTASPSMDGRSLVVVHIGVEHAAKKPPLQWSGKASRNGAELSHLR
jgi:hypothetical protein